MERLTRIEYQLLKWAVNEAETWRGSMTGDTYTGRLEEFDRKIKACRSVLLDRSPYNVKKDAEPAGLQAKSMTTLETILPLADK